VQCAVRVIMSGGYVIVEFGEGGGGVAAVPVSWLVLVDGQLKCYWPKKNAVKAAQSQLPVRGDWTAFSVRKISRQDKVYQNYDAHLLEKVRKATVTSAIDTTDLSDIDQERRAKIPKIKKARHATKTSEIKMPVAPLYHPIARHQPSEATAPSDEMTSTTESPSICPMEQLECIQPRSSTPVTAEAVETQQVNFCEVFEAAMQTQPVHQNGMAYEIQTVAEVYAQPVLLNAGSEVQTQAVHRNGVASEIQNVADVHESVLLSGESSAKLDQLLLRMENIEKQQSEILHILKSMKNGHGRSEDLDIEDFGIPVDCEEDYEKLAEDLKDKLKRRTLVGSRYLLRLYIC